MNRAPSPPFPAVSVPGPPAIDGSRGVGLPGSCLHLVPLESPPAPLPGEGGTDSVSESSGIQVIIEIIIIKKSEET